MSHEWHGPAPGRAAGMEDAMNETVTLTRERTETCPHCGWTEFNPGCPDCVDLEEALRQLEQGIEGYDM